MSNDPIHISPMFRIDVSPEASQQNDSQEEQGNVVVGLLRELVAGQARQNQLLQELTENTAQMQKQRMTELQQWKDANPQLAQACREAAETLSRVQVQFLETMTEEIADSQESLLDSDFMLSEFVDRFGPRMAHLNGVLQVLAQLGSGVPAGGN
jgi:predicted DsbA family dithiol-disulfide isomerase